MEFKEVEKVGAACVCAMGRRHWGRGESRGGV